MQKQAGGDHTSESEAGQERTLTSFPFTSAELPPNPELDPPANPELPNPEPPNPELEAPPNPAPEPPPLLEPPLSSS